MLWDRCPVCLSVALVYSGQTVGWIKVPFGTAVGFGPGDIVLDAEPALAAERGTAATPHFSARFAVDGRPCQQLLRSCNHTIVKITNEFRNVGDAARDAYAMSHLSAEACT